MKHVVPVLTGTRHWLHCFVSVPLSASHCIVVLLLFAVEKMELMQKAKEHAVGTAL